MLINSSFEEFYTIEPISGNTYFNGLNLKVIAQYDPNYEERITFREYENGTVEYTSGMCLDLLLALQVSMGFNYISMKGNGWDGLLPNGTWTGMAAQIINGEGDVSIAQTSMIMSMNQMTKISFLHVTAAGHFVAIFKQPRNSLSKNLMTSAFRTKCWIFLILYWAILALIVKLITLIQGEREVCQHNTDSSFRNEILLWTLTTAIGKAWFINPTTNYLKTICLVSALLTCCVYSAYLGQLTVNLITENVPIKTFQDLVQSNLELAADKWLPLNIGVQRRNQNQLDENEKLDIGQGICQVMQPSSKLAFVTLSDSISTAYFKTSNTDISFCKILSRVQLYNQKTPAAMFVKKGSPLKENLNLNILKLIESGITNRLNNHYTIRTEIQCHARKTNYRGGLRLHDVFTPFLIIVVGFCTCCLFLIIELLC